MGAVDLVSEHVSSGRLPSAVFGIADAHGIRELVAFGAGTDDRYPLFSITKPIVGLAAARAIEQGGLDWDTPLASVISGYDERITLSQLASHRAGRSEPDLDTAVPLAQELRERGEDFAPGSAVRYSTMAFTGIAELIESSTGIGWEEEVQTFAPGLSCDLSDAHGVSDAAEAGLNYAAFAAQRNPGAGLGGRATDLLSLGSELLRISGGEDGLISAETLSTMREPLTMGLARFEEPTNLAAAEKEWGFTWALRNRASRLDDTDCFGHGGWAGTEFWLHPSAGLCWVLLTGKAQHESVDADALDNAVVRGY